MAARGSMRRHRASIASATALAVATAGLLTYAVTADGFRAHDAQLNDGGIWVTNGSDGFHGRINKPIGQLDGALFAQLNTSLDVVQDGASVVAVDVSDGLIAPIDPARVDHPEGDEAAIPAGADVALAGGSLAVGDPDKGRVWATTVSPGTVPSVLPLDQQTEPLAEVGDDAALTVTRSGAVLAVSADEDRMLTLRPAAGGFAEPEAQDLDLDLGEQVDLSAVGERAVLLDAGRLSVVGGGSAEVPNDAVLQQAGPDATTVLVASGDALLEVDLGSGEVSPLVEGVAGTPAAPVRLGDCVYAAWSGGAGTVATVCGGGEPVVSPLGGRASNLVFRVNRGEILLNDRTSGRVWQLDTQEPMRLDNWEDFLRPETKDPKESDNEKEDTGDRRPPQAKPDEFGARPGRLTVLHPLDNDSAPQGRILSIRSVEAPPDVPVSISPDGQTLQVRLPETSRGTRFEYYIDDGRSGVSAHASVSVTARADSANGAPHLRQHFKPRLWTVPAAGVLDVPVLPDWRDHEDGDPLTVETAEAVGGDTSGATARVTASGRIRFTAPATGGPVTVRYGVSDGIGDPVDHELRFRVQDPAEREAVAGVAEPDIVTGEVGRPITIRPLGNDLPGSDPVTPDAQLAIAGKVSATGGARVVTDVHEGTLTFRSDIARTFFLDYEAAYGKAPPAGGRIRVDVRPHRSPPPDPVAMPDTVTLRGQAATLVDVLANDIDPTGGMLVVQRAAARVTNELDVAVVDGRWLRISSRQGAVEPNPTVVRYTISNGARSGVEGEVVVRQEPRPADNTPVTEIDRVTVRAGAAVAVPVLDNDFSPAGDPLSLVGHVAGEQPGQLTVQRPGDEKVPTGQAFVAGRLVRYVAPQQLTEEQTFTVRYLATNEAGDTAPGRAELRVVPLDAPNQAPEPPVLEGRVVSGDTVRLKVPGSGVDPDGDSVTLLGLGAPGDGHGAPQLGRVVRFGANSLEYQAYPGSQGTEEFTYLVTDAFGAVASGTVRVAVSPPGAPQPPLAVNDALTVEPGRRATIDVLGNDLLAAGDRVEIELVDPPAGAELESPTGPLLVDGPDAVDGRNVELVYEISNGIDSSRGLVTVRAQEPYNNPPVVFDAFGPHEEGERATVDVLETAYDPDGEPEDLRIAEVFAPRGVEATVDGGRISVLRGEQPLVVPFRVEDADGGAATASLYVPATGAGLPYVVPEGLISLEPGETRRLKLADHVEDPAGGTVSFTLKDRIWPSPSGAVSARITGEGTFEVTAADDYRGPGAVTFEVTTGEAVDDPDGVRAVLAVPVQVGDPTPILRCPSDAVDVPQGESVQLDIGALCHVWTADPADAAGLEFEAGWKRSSDGISIDADGGSVVEVSARGDVRPGTEATLEVSADGSEPGLVNLRAVRSPPPSLAPIRIADMKAGEERVVDLSRYLRPGVSEPEPTLVAVDQITGLDVRATREGASSVRIVTGDQVDGRAEFRVVMSDVSGTAGPERRVEGRIALDILDRPDRPLAPVPGRTVRSREVLLGWRAPAANGAPITAYELRHDRGGGSTRCGGTSCNVTGLQNGTWYRFQVRARNAVGWSEWSTWSARARPDERPGEVRNLRVVERGDGTVTLAWDPPANKTSAIQFYSVTWPGGSAQPRRTTFAVPGLDNNKPYEFSVQAKNALDYGPLRSVTSQSIGTPQAPAAVSVTPADVASDATAVTVSWTPVDPPNGPGPMHYTVLRANLDTGGETVVCRDVAATECVNTGVAYDGTRYDYRVTGTNDGGRGRTGPAATAQWSAVGKPETFGDGAWSVAPSGGDNTARVTFTPPNPRGRASATRVALLLDGVERTSWPAQQGRSDTQTFSTPVDGHAYAVQLKLCNEQTCGDPSGGKGLQTYGPVGVSQQTPVQDPTRIECRWTVNPNGLPVTVYIDGSNRGSYGPADGNNTVTYEKTGYNQSLSCDIRVVTQGGARADVSRAGTNISTGPPPRTVEVSRGSRCHDGNSLPDCNVDGTGTDCLHASCGFIQITTANFTTGRVTCDIYDSATSGSGPWTTKTIDTNRTVETRAYFGFPNRSVWAVCGGVESPHYDWPDS